MFLTGGSLLFQCVVMRASSAEVAALFAEDGSSARRPRRGGGPQTGLSHPKDGGQQDVIVRAPVRVFGRTAAAEASRWSGAMGALQSSPAPRDQADLAEKTGFSLEQIAVLHKRFKQLSHNEETLRREHFKAIPDLACNPIRSQIIQAFFDRRNFHQNDDGTVEEISFEEFLVVMSHFRPPSQHMSEEQRESVRKEKLRFLFNMHDTDNDGMITLEEYRHVVEELLSRSGALGKETAKSIADAAMLEVASISMGHMEPDEFYEGITFEHFLKLLGSFEIESKMSIRFLNMDASTLCA